MEIKNGISAVKIDGEWYAVDQRKTKDKFGSTEDFKVVIHKDGKFVDIDASHDPKVEDFRNSEPTLVTPEMRQSVGASMYGTRDNSGNMSADNADVDKLIDDYVSEKHIDIDTDGELLSPAYIEPWLVKRGYSIVDARRIIRKMRDSLSGS